MTVIDAHHHLWPQEAIPHQSWRPADDDKLARAFEIDEFKELRRTAGVDASVIMQSVDSEHENLRLLQYLIHDSTLCGAVAWAPISRPDQAARYLQTLQEEWAVESMSHKLLGLRCLTGRDDIDWALETEGLRFFQRLAASGLVWDVVPITRSQRQTVAHLARAVPELRIVVDHMAAPAIRESDRDEWSREVRELSRNENVAMKMSVGIAVLDSMSEWSPAFLSQSFETVLGAFGAQRSMLGSNWPVVELRTSYNSAWTDSLQVLEELLSPDEKSWAVGHTARSWYKIAGTP